MGLFIGQLDGYGFFEYHLRDGTIIPGEYPIQPIQFYTEEEAEAYLSRWRSGRGDCFIEEGIG
jgi:hypothetical protein